MSDCHRSRRQVHHHDVSVQLDGAISGAYNPSVQGLVRESSTCNSVNPRTAVISDLLFLTRHPTRLSRLSLCIPVKFGRVEMRLCPNSASEDWVPFPPSLRAAASADTPTTQGRRGSRSATAALAKAELTMQSDMLAWVWQGSAASRDALREGISRKEEATNISKLICWPDNGCFSLLSHAEVVEMLQLIQIFDAVKIAIVSIERAQPFGRRNVQSLKMSIATDAQDTQFGHDGR